MHSSLLLYILRNEVCRMWSWRTYLHTVTCYVKYKLVLSGRVHPLSTKPSLPRCQVRRGGGKGLGKERWEGDRWTRERGARERVARERERERLEKHIWERERERGGGQGKRDGKVRNRRERKWLDKGRCEGERWTMERGRARREREGLGKHRWVGERERGRSEKE